MRSSQSSEPSNKQAVFPFCPLQKWDVSLFFKGDDNPYFAEQCIFMLERAASFYKALLFLSFILDISGFFMSLCGLLYSFFSPSLKRGLSWRRNVLDTSLDYKPIPIYAVVLLYWLCEYAAGWQTQLEQVGEKKKKKKSYKPALCVLGSSTVYFYCTWSINLSIDLCCHYFLILCLSVFYAYEMRVMHCFNLCEWPLVCVRDKPAEGCQMHWMLLWIKMSIPFLCKLLCDNSAA